MLVIYFKQMYMEHFAREFTETLRPYREMFDIYYIGDEKIAKNYFITNLFPDVLPMVTIIDPDKKVDPVQSSHLSEES